MQTLLEKTRNMNQRLSMAASEVDFAGSAKVVRDSIDCNVYVMDKMGKILGYALLDDFDCPVLEEEIMAKGEFPATYNERLFLYRETAANLTSDDCTFCGGKECPHTPTVTTVLPIISGGERLGTLLLARGNGREFSDEDLVLAEHAATVTAMEIVRHNRETVEEETRNRTAVQVALGTLSFSELNAMRHIFEELGGTEGFLVASKVADRVGITRSVIVNALRKFESAGVIESRSLGMKGTYIRVLNEKLLEELKKLR
jgi:transcriptional pleiotropic repressor